MFVEACSIAMESLLYQETVSIMFTFRCGFTAGQETPTLQIFALQSMALVGFIRTRVLKTAAIITLRILDDLCYLKTEIKYLCVSLIVVLTTIFLPSILSLVPF